MAKKNGEFVEEYLIAPTFDADGVQATSGIGRDGLEYPDPVPMAPPVGYDAPPDLVTMIRTMIKGEQIRQRADEAGMETFEEADDFEIYDDPDDPLTDYEKIFEPPAGPPAEASPSPSAAAPQTPTAKEGGEGGGSSNGPPAAAPSDPRAQSST